MKPNTCPPHEVGKFAPHLRGPKVDVIRGPRIETLQAELTATQRAVRMMPCVLAFLRGKADVPKREIAKALGLPPATGAVVTDLNIALQKLKTEGHLRRDKHGWTLTHDEPDPAKGAEDEAPRGAGGDPGEPIDVQFEEV